MCGLVEDVPKLDLARQMGMLDEALYTAITAKELCVVAAVYIIRGASCLSKAVRQGGAEPDTHAGATWRGRG